MSREDYTDLAIQPYQESTLVRFLMNLLPGGGAIDTALVKTRDDIVHQREERFFSALSSGKERLPSNLAQSVPFVHRFIITNEAVVREAEESKIELFANLLLNGPTETELHASDYKQLLQILTDLTAKEVALLVMLEDYECKVRDREKKNEVQKTKEFWKDYVEQAERELGIPRAEVTGTLTRISRSGCYHEITGTYFDYEGGRGATTGLWRKFRKFVLDKAQGSQ